MMPKENYDQILQMFKGNEVERVYLNEPFFIAEIAVASDAIAMVWFNKSLANDVVELLGEKSRGGVLNIMNKCVPNEEFVITVAQLKQAFANYPTTPELIEEGKNVDCDACVSVGEVTWEFDFGGRTYTEEFECPVCNGSGYSEESRIIPTGNRITDKFFNTKILRSHFANTQVERLLKVANLLGEGYITLFHQYEGSSTGASAFSIGDKVNVLLMPVYQDDDNAVSHSFQKIK